MIARLVAVVLCVMSAEAAPQSPPECPASVSPAAFLDCARAASERFQDRSVAILAGYRPIGRDFPSMGEHWIRTGLVFDGTLDAARPEILNYVIVAGQPRLVGLGYAVPLRAGEAAPEGPAGQDAWHDHFRSIEDETVLPLDVHVHGQSGPRVAMLHTWIWAPNPDGVFATENWALPFVRLGLNVPEVIAPSAAKALSLLADGTDFFARQFVAAAPDRLRLDSTRAAMESVRPEIGDIVSNSQNGQLTVSELSRLAAIWDDIARAGGASP